MMQMLLDGEHGVVAVEARLAEVYLHRIQQKDDPDLMMSGWHARGAEMSCDHDRQLVVVWVHFQDGQLELGAAHETQREVAGEQAKAQDEDLALVIVVSMGLNAAPYLL